MNKKGFTLIELLGSIVILAIIAAIAFPAILGLLNSSQNEIDNAKKNIVEGAAKDYVDDNVNDFPRNTNLSKKIDVKDLINDGYISSTSINEKEDEEIYNGCVLVTASYKTVEEDKENPNPSLSYDFAFKTKDEC